jgi:ABC-2 type transport system permease protein
MMFVFVLAASTTSGSCRRSKLLLLPGIIAISMVFSGIWSVAMPLIAEFQFTKEIEDRLLAPIEIEWLAVENSWRHGQALVTGFVVIPLASLIMGSGWQSVLSHPCC